MRLLPEYEDMLERGEYDNEEELCNGEGLNWDEIYDYEDDEEDD